MNLTLNESIVEDAALERFRELGYAVEQGLHLAPGEPTAECRHIKRQNLNA